MKRTAPLFSRPGKRLTQSDSGSVLIYTVIASLIVASLSITYFSSTMINSRIAFDRQQKKKSLYAADGRMTLLAQECYDGHQYRYGVSSDEEKNWPGEYKIEAMHSLKALTVEGGAVLSANVNQSAWVAQDHQKWFIVSVGKNQFRIVNKKSGLCLNVDGYSTADGANISQAPVKTTLPENQRWYLVDAGAGYYKIESVRSYKVAGVANASQTEGANVQQMTYTLPNGSSHQKWKITKLSGEESVSAPEEYFRIRNKWLSAQYLRTNNDVVESGPYAATDISSHWKFEEYDADHKRIINRLTSQSMHIEHLLPWIECSTGSINWHSNHWAISEPETGYKYINNRWYPNIRINIFHNKGYAQNSNDFPGVKVQEYRITSSASNPERDPKDWLFKGSRDGVTWHTINAQSGQTFASRALTKIYTFANDSLFNYYRLDITASNGAQTNMFFEAENLLYYTNISTVGNDVNSSYSNNTNVKGHSDAVGEYLEFRLPNIPAGIYHIDLYYLAGDSRGIMQASIGGVNIGSPKDHYAASFIYQLCHSIGDITWATTGEKLLKYTVTGKNSLSSNYKMDIDYIILTPLSVHTFEAENLSPWSSNPSGAAVLNTDASHSNGYAVMVNSTAVGHYVEFTIPNVAAGTYQIDVYTKDLNSRGQAQASIDGANIGPVQDFYRSPAQYQVYHPLGTKTWPSTSDMKLRFTITGKNAASSGYTMLIDYIRLTGSASATSSDVSLSEFKIIPTNGYTGFAGDSITARGEDVAGGATKEKAFDGLSSTSWRDTITPSWIRYQYVRPAQTPWAEWVFEGLPVDTFRLPEGVYKLVNVRSGMAWDVQGASTSDYAKIVQNVYKEQTNQKFQLSYLGNGMYKILNVKSGKAVGVTGSAQINASLQQAPYASTADQKWSFVPMGSGTFKIYSQLSGSYYVCQDGSITEGTFVTIDTGSSPVADSLLWRPVRVATTEEISARGEKGTYPKENAFDGEVSTKWVDTNVTWIQYKFISPVAVLGYNITSADDLSDRDPKDWTVRGSNDGSTWTTLDTKTNQSFASRYLTKTYTLANTMEYNYYQLNITANHGAPYTQLAELLFATITSSDGLGVDTLGDCNVTWQIKQNGRNQYTLATEATILDAKSSRNSFKTPLIQYLEVASGGLTNMYGATVAIPVTYYDFHSDRTNPEFEQPSTVVGIKPNMVAATLDADRKPTLGPAPNLNYYIQYWFKESSSISTSVVINMYDHTRDYEECGPDETLEPGAPNVSYGTRLAYQAFENVKFQDVLVFTHLGNGMYEYKDDDFFPLDNKGFGTEWQYKGVCESQGMYHNFAFTMELHRTFTKVPDQTFWFCGDDDVWLFINNQLVLDIGGVHGPITGSVNINALGLDNYTEYPVDFFFCERHSIGSHIWIQTNMFVYLPETKARRHWKRDYGLLD